MMIKIGKTPTDEQMVWWWCPTGQGILMGARKGWCSVDSWLLKLETQIRSAGSLAIQQSRWRGQEHACPRGQNPRAANGKAEARGHRTYGDFHNYYSRRCRPKGRNKVTQGKTHMHLVEPERRGWSWHRIVPDPESKSRLRAFGLKYQLYRGKSYLRITRTQSSPEHWITSTKRKRILISNIKQRRNAQLSHVRLTSCSVETRRI